MEQNNRPKFNIYTGERIVYPDEQKMKYDPYTGQPIVKSNDTPNENCAVETPAVETPAVETPAVETPAVEAPVVEAPVVETPVVETPVVETPVVETPAVETPAVEVSEPETPAVEEQNSDNNNSESTTSASYQPNGEYRYVPPYSERVYSPSLDNTAVPAENKKEKKKKKKSKTSISAGALAIILVAAIILSAAAGFGGAVCYEELINRPDSASSVIDDTKPENNKANEPEDSTPVKEPEKNTSYVVSGDDLSAPEVAAMVASSVVEIEVESELQYGMYQYIVSGAGSGIVASEDGNIITNAHVIINQQTGEVASNITVRLNNGDEYTAEVTGFDKDGDIALLKIDATGLNAVTFGNSDNISVGQDIILVGNPLGQLGGTVTKGIISATSREILIESKKMNLIQIDAAANPGNSGGGLFNMKGELIGVLNSGITNDDDGTSIDGISFCIPVNDVVKIKDELILHGYVTGKVFLGISTYDATDAYTAYYYFRSQSTGVYIYEVVEGYNDKVLEYGDRITAIGDQEVVTTTDITTYLQNCQVGDTIKFTIVRQGKVMQVNIKCFEYVPAEKDPKDTSVKK